MKTLVTIVWRINGYLAWPLALSEVDQRRCLDLARLFHQQGADFAALAYFEQDDSCGWRWSR